MIRPRLPFLLSAIFLSILRVLAQDHAAHGMPMGSDTMRMDGMMTHAYSVELPMGRNASGTAWLPDSTPMFGYMVHHAGWMFMFHGNVFLRYTNVNVNNENRRGEARVDAPNWFMAMAQRRMGRNGLLAFTLMPSLDPFTVGNEGYPLLFQTGESYQGKPLIDRQHPHDLFSALSVGYTQRLAPEFEITGYAGYPGEPALGPPAFMHRISALANPDAPLGHHWADATHITFGVGTLGLRYKWVKVEASSFTGREPDELRTDFDPARFDSRSFRILIAPSPNWSLQASQGYLNSPEELFPEENITRSTVSIAHVANFMGSSLNTILLWGLNDAGYDHLEHSALVESALVSEKANTYLRFEWIQKSAEELGLEDQLGDDFIGEINTLTLGHSQRILTWAKTDLFLGAKVTGHMIQQQWKPFYGDQPLSFGVDLRITPQRMRAM